VDDLDRRDRFEGCRHNSLTPGTIGGVATQAVALDMVGQGIQDSRSPYTHAREYAGEAEGTQRRVNGHEEVQSESAWSCCFDYYYRSSSLNPPPP